MKTAGLVLILIATGTLATAEELPWLVRFEGGSASLHSWEPRGSWARVDVGRAFYGGALSASAGTTFSNAGSGYAALSLGLEALPFPNAPVSPFVRGEVGLMAEGDLEYAGFLGALGAGLSVRVNEPVAFRGGLLWGTHGDVNGPSGYCAGIQLRW